MSPVQDRPLSWPERQNVKYTKQVLPTEFDGLDEWAHRPPELRACNMLKRLQSVRKQLANQETSFFDAFALRTFLQTSETFTESSCANSGASREGSHEQRR